LEKLLSKQNRSLIVQLLAYIKPHRWWVAVSVAASLMSSAVDIAAGLLIKEVTDSESAAFGSGLSRLVLFVACLTVVGVLVKYLVKYASGVYSTRAVRDIKESVASHISRLEVSELDKRHSGDLVSRLNNDIMSLQSYLETNVSEIVYRPFVFAGTFAFLFILNWKLLLATVLLIPVTIYWANRIARPVSEFTRNFQEGESKAAAVVVDSVGGVYVEKAYNLSRLIAGKYQAAVDQILHYRLREQRQLSYLVPFEMSIRLIPFLCCAGLGGYLAVRGSLSTGGLFSFIYLLPNLINPLASVSSQLAEFRNAMVSVGRILDIRKLPTERSDGMWNVNVDGMTEQSAVVFEQVDFSYPGGKEVLKALDLVIPEGRTTALVGTSGGGKSTILKMICGYYEPAHGNISLFGRNLSEWNLNQARSMMSIVSQDAYLFPMTIADNIAFGKPGATMDEVVTAAKAAGAHDFVVQMPEGYQSSCGERGNLLSGGQRQRISIARAILKDAPILLLDEPTSALDNQLEALVQEAIERLARGKTVLVIAHRLSTIRAADQIAVLHEGRVTELGSHEQLIAQEVCISSYT
jgi:ABC-type multidrug transport system fused ATPase/permease subunit